MDIAELTGLLVLIAFVFLFACFLEIDGRCSGNRPLPTRIRKTIARAIGGATASWLVEEIRGHCLQATS